MKLIPTMNLRIVMRSHQIARHSDYAISEIRPVLQQQFGLSSGGHVWRDVPVVAEEEQADG